MFPLEFRREVNREETRVMGLPGGESCDVLSLDCMNFFHVFYAFCIIYIVHLCAIDTRSM